MKKIITVPLILLCACTSVLYAAQSNNRIRETLEQQFKKAVEGSRIDFDAAQKAVKSLQNLQDPLSQRLTAEYQNRLINLRRALLNAQIPCTTQLRLCVQNYNKAKNENIQLRKEYEALKAQQEEASFMQSETSISKNQSESEANTATTTQSTTTTKYIASDNQTSNESENIADNASLKKLKKQISTEFGKTALEKILQNKKLKLADIDPQAHFFSLIDLKKFNPETGSFSKAKNDDEADAGEEKSTEESSINDIKFGLAKALQENETLKKQAQEKEKEKKDALEKLASGETTPQSSQEEILLLQHKLQDAETRYTELKQKFTSGTGALSGAIGIGLGATENIVDSTRITEIKNRLKALLGNNATNMIMRTQEELNVKNVVDSVDRNTPFIQLILHGKEGESYEFF